MLSEQQKLAVDSESRLSWVRSGAGTGKTTVIKARSERLTKEGKNILITTFTRDARRELQERIKDGDIRTLGSLAWRLSERSRDGKTLITESMKTSLLDKLQRELKIIKDYEIENLQTEDAEVFNYGNYIDIMYANGISKDSELITKIDPDMAKLMTAYENYLLENNLFDPAMMFIHAIEHAHRYGFYDEILVDEAQDLSMAQLLLLKELAGDKSSLFFVGDDDQSIYSFRGAIPDVMNDDFQFKFHGKYKPERFELTENYRCTKQILFHALKSINSNPNHKKKILTSDRNGPPVSIVPCTNGKKEASIIALKIKELIDKGSSSGEIAVISRINRALTNIASELLKENIPFVMADGNYFERTEVIDILAYLNLFANTYDRNSLERIINRPDRKILPTDMESVLTGMYDGSMDAIVALRSVASMSNDKKGAKGMLELANLIEEMSISGQSHTGKHILAKFLDKTKYYDTMKKKGSKFFEHSIDAMLNLARMEENMSFIEFCCVLSDRSETYGETIMNDGTRVFVGTIFGSKGLEWDHVFIPGFVKGEFPSDRNLMNTDNKNWLTSLFRYGGLQEEKRIFYVGLTRARKTCQIFYPKARGAGKFTREKQISPLMYSAGLALPTSASRSAGSWKK